MGLGGKLLVTGAGGRLGRLLRGVWAQNGGPARPVVWQGRSGDMPWDFAGDPPEAWPKDAVILHLAGVTAGSDAELAVNVDLARSLVHAAQLHRAAHVLFASTIAVYRPGPMILAEATRPDPQSAYGRAKLKAEQVLALGLAQAGIGLTVLRIANVAGADALLGGAAARGPAQVVLDPVPGQPAGPERSYIGPVILARVLARLVDAAPDLPPLLNLAQPGCIAMGDLLDAAGLDWRFGPERPGVVPRVLVDTARLQGLVPLDTATPQSLVDELRSLRGVWS